jgi:chemotaxis protein CheC
LSRYTETQLDALRELANIGSGKASGALSSMLGRSVDITVPSASVLLLFTPRDAELMCGLLGVEAGTEIGVSALMEIGNIVGSSYINALAEMTGLDLEPSPPAAATDFRSAIVETVLAERAGAGDSALLLDSDLVVEREDCSVSFLLVPDEGGVELMLGRLGL